jgi:hypothetical protein
LFGRLRQDVKVFVVFFHPVFLPGIFFQGGGIALELLQLFFGIFYLAQEVVAAFFQLVEFALVLKVGGEDILLVKKTDPYREHQRGEQVLVLKKGGYVLEELH